MPSRPHLRLLPGTPRRVLRAGLLLGAAAIVVTAVFGLFGPVDWQVVAVAAPASLLGGFLGARIATRIPATPLRVFIVAFGIAVSVYLFTRV